MATDIYLESGENREALQASRKCYFFYVSPTGVELGLKDCPSIRKKWQTTRAAHAERLTTQEFEVLSPTTIKMVLLGTSFGKPRQMYHIFLNISDSESEILIDGIEGWGKFKGRAVVDFEKSNITEEQLMSRFNFQTTRPPIITAAKKNARIRKLLVG